MRTNIEIDDQLMAEAMRAAGLKTKREVVEEALRLLVRQRGQRALLDLAGKIHWEGDLDEMRTGRFLHEEQSTYHADEENSEQNKPSDKEYSADNDDDTAQNDDRAANGNPG